MLNPFIRRMDLGAQRKLQDALGELGAMALAKNVHFEQIPELNAVWAYNKSIEPDKAILYLHGGAYTAGSLSYAKGFGGVLAEQTHYSTLVLGYRLAPENPWPAALEDALAAYRHMLERYRAQDIAFVGESAGGGLCFSLALRCKELHLPMPACIVAVSPWTDLSLSGKIRKRDPILQKETLLSSARMYGGDDLKNPLISPLYGDLDGMPDSLIFVGDRELLLDDSIRMAKGLKKSGCRCELHIASGMWHAYVLFGIPEAWEAVSRIKEYLAEETAHAKRS